MVQLVRSTFVPVAIVAIAVCLFAGIARACYDQYLAESAKRACIETQATTLMAHQEGDALKMAGAYCDVQF